MGGITDQGWLILENGPHIIGLFRGTVDKNMLTFNPGWDQDAKPLPAFTDVRERQRKLKGEGIQFVSEADERTSGPEIYRGRSGRQSGPGRPSSLGRVNVGSA